MTDGLTLPPKLLQSARFAVQTYRETGKLIHKGMFDLAQSEPPPVWQLPQVRDLMHVGKVSTFVFKSCHVAAILTVLAAWRWNWWLLTLLIPCVLVYVWSGRHMRNSMIALAIYFLAMDILTSNFAGWGDACPGLRAIALNARGEKLGVGSRRWLDRFIPHAEKLPAAVIKEMAP